MARSFIRAVVEVTRARKGRSPGAFHVLFTQPPTKVTTPAPYHQHMDPVVSFIVRASLDAGGGLSGVVERVRTGEKRRFTGAEAMAEAIIRMMQPPAGDDD